MTYLNKLELVCSVSDYESVEKHLESFIRPKVGCRKHGFLPFLQLERIANDPQWYFLERKEIEKERSLWPSCAKEK